MKKLIASIYLGTIIVGGLTIITIRFGWDPLIDLLKALGCTLFSVSLVWSLATILDEHNE